MVTKNSTLTEKVNYIKEGLSNTESVDSTFLLNLLNLLGGGNLTQDIFDKEDIIFSNLADFSDIKTEVKKQLTQFKKEICFYYLSAITSCHFIAVCKKEDIKEIPQLHKLVMGNVGIFTLNAWLSKYISSIDTSKLIVINDAIFIMKTLNTPLAILDGFVTTLFKED